MTALIKIGNSEGIRIPKKIIEEANLKNSELSFEITENGLLIKPIKKTYRKNWEKQINSELKTSDYDFENDFENDFLEFDMDSEEWEWEWE